MPSPASAPATTSPFLLLFRNAGLEAHAHLTPEQRAELTEQWNTWYDSLVQAGKASQGAPLGLNGRVLSGPRGRSVVDGPYAEAKEVVGGYVMIHAADLDEATELAKGVPGLAIGLTVEVRPVLSASPALEGVRGHAAGH